VAVNDEAFTVCRRPDLQIAQTARENEPASKSGRCRPGKETSLSCRYAVKVQRDLLCPDRIRDAGILEEPEQHKSKPHRSGGEQACWPATGRCHDGDCPSRGDDQQLVPLKPEKKPSALVSGELDGF
jgi:hypothetical protein